MNDNNVVYYVKSDFYSYARGTKIWTTTLLNFYYPSSAFITNIEDSEASLARKVAYIGVTMENGATDHFIN